MRLYRQSRTSRRQRRGTSGKRCFRPALETLEPRLALASATADVSARFQDTLSDPIAVTGPLFAEVQTTVGPTLGPNTGQARALTAGRLQSRSQTGGVAG